MGRHGRSEMRSIREEGVGGEGAPRGRPRLWRPHNEEVGLAGT